MAFSTLGSDIRLRSEAFLTGGAIPRRHSAQGGNISPSFRWEHVPENVAELALICESTNRATGENLTHWIIYKISPDEHGIPEGVPPLARLEEPFGAMHGKNSWNEIGYRGPIPGTGLIYRFQLYALGKELTVGANLDRDALLKIMSKQVLYTAEISAVFES